jgi:hypothetical protein
VIPDPGAGSVWSSYCVWYGIYINDSDAAQLPGAWQVDVYTDGSLVLVQNFAISDNTIPLQPTEGFSWPMYNIPVYVQQDPSNAYQAVLSAMKQWNYSQAWFQQTYGLPPRPTYNLVLSSSPSAPVTVVFNKTQTTQWWGWTYTSWDYSANGTFTNVTASSSIILTLRDGTPLNSTALQDAAQITLGYALGLSNVTKPGDLMNMYSPSFYDLKYPTTLNLYALYELSSVKQYYAVPSSYTLPSNIPYTSFPAYSVTTTTTTSSTTSTSFSTSSASSTTGVTTTTSTSLSSSRTVTSSSASSSSSTANPAPEVEGYYFTDSAGTRISEPLLGERFNFVLDLKNPDTVSHTYSISVVQACQPSSCTMVGAPNWPSQEAFLGLPSQWAVNPTCTGDSTSVEGAQCADIPREVTITAGGTATVAFPFTDTWAWIPPFDYRILVGETIQTVLLAKAPVHAFSYLFTILGNSYFVLNQGYSFTALSGTSTLASFQNATGVPLIKEDDYLGSIISSLPAGDLTLSGIGLCLSGVFCGAGLAAIAAQAGMIALQSCLYIAATDPSPDYHTVVAPSPFVLSNGTAYQNLPIVLSSPAQWRIAEGALAQVLSYQNATTISEERYFAALANGSQYYAGLQLQAATSYAKLRDQAMASFQTQLSSVENQLPNLNSTTVQKADAHLTTNGLPPVESQILSQLGLSESEPQVVAGLVAFNSTALLRFPLGSSLVAVGQALVAEENALENQSSVAITKSSTTSTSTAATTATLSTTSTVTSTIPTTSTATTTITETATTTSTATAVPTLTAVPGPTTGISDTELYAVATVAVVVAIGLVALTLRRHPRA